MTFQLGISPKRSPRIICLFSFGVFKVEKTVSFRNHVYVYIYIGPVVFFLHGKHTEHMQISARKGSRDMRPAILGVDGDCQADAQTICKLLKLTGCAT